MIERVLVLYRTEYRVIKRVLVYCIGQNEGFVRWNQICVIVVCTTEPYACQCVLLYKSKKSNLHFNIHLFYVAHLLPPNVFFCFYSAGKSQPATPQNPSSRPMKKKIVETEPEPAYTEVVESVRNVDLLVTAVADYSKYTCKTTSIHFRDTLMFQTRVYE